jgi:uncharacterized protein YciI
VHLVLEYTLADDYLQRRAALREEHLALLRAAHERGELLMAGALPDPYDRALLVWTAPREVVSADPARPGSRPGRANGAPILQGPALGLRGVAGQGVLPQSGSSRRRTPFAVAPAR